MGRPRHRPDPIIHPAHPEFVYEIETPATKGRTTRGSKGVFTAFLYSLYGGDISCILGVVYAFLLCYELCHEGRRAREFSTVYPGYDECTAAPIYCLFISC